MHSDNSEMWQADVWGPATTPTHDGTDTGYKDKSSEMHRLTNQTVWAQILVESYELYDTKNI